ncbi:MAG: DNA polymerase III subunit alpha [Dehalococcoidia bacterium]|nr:DNA polymerase III subunit alpha [Dehalococcoidia bacterium]
MFTHLHTHTEYSLLDGLSRLEPLVHRTKELGMESLAITDHGGMYGAIDFYQLAKSEGIRPIIGCEMYVAPGSRHERNPDERSPYHMTVLARDYKGYQNLVKLVTTSHLEGFYYRPRVDREILERYHEGLIVMSGCASGEVPLLITQGRLDEARATASWYREVFGDYYLEIMRHGDVPELPAINSGLLDIHRDLGIPIVATNDSHYILQEHARFQDILICIHTNTNVEDSKRLRMEEASYYLKSPQEMEDLFHDLPEAIENTQLIADKCDLDIDFSQLRLPQYQVPEGTTPFEYLSNICWEGLSERMPNASDSEKERLKYELEVIRQTNFDNYFLVVWDIARFVRERDIFFAVRGSAAASLVLYCLGVTNVNPLPYRLVFERFLNLERKEMPDIDMDFQDDRREEVINYVVDKYGREHVAHIITFGTLGARAAIRDVGRALAMPYADVDRVARMIPMRLGITLKDAKSEAGSELGEAIEADESIRELIQTAEGLEGVTRHSSTHAAGVVISQQPLDEVVPLQRPQKSDGSGSVATTTQYAMDPVAALGLLKMDFLGLVNLTVLAKARDLISEHRGIHFDLTEIPLDDTSAFDLLSRGETVGVFQLEGSGMTRYIKELKPNTLSDVAAMIALYRPGPMEHISTFIDAKHGRVPVSYLHPDLEDILEETYGVIVYQDQVLHIAQTFAGYTLGEADIVRKAMGKKIPAIMAEERDKFLEGAKGQGFTSQLSEQVFSLVEPFAGYAFNKAHSVSYGLISYWTAYLKANYTPEYMVALLNSYVGHTDRITTAIAECQRLKIQVLPPSFTKGYTDFTLESQQDGSIAIRYGMGAVKNVGTASVDAVVESRERLGGFESIEEMCRESEEMAGVNRKTLECLIKVGALDDFGDRAAVLESMDRIISLAQSEARLRDSNQSTMFDLFGESVSAPLTTISLPDVRSSDREREEWERELIGVSLSSISVLSSILTMADSEHIVFRSDIDQNLAGQKVSVVGQVASVTQRFTRNNKPFIIAGLGLMDGQIEVFVWEEQMQESEGLWEVGQTVAVAGTVRVREDQISISCTNAGLFSPDEPEKQSEEPSVTKSPAAVVSEVRDSAARYDEDLEQKRDYSETSANGTANGASDKNGDVNGEIPSLAHSRPVVPNQLSLMIRETDSPVDDQMMLDDVKRLLLEYSGSDQVMLEIAAQGQIHRLEWTTIQVNACDELRDRLEEVLADSGSVSLQPALT